MRVVPHHHLVPSLTVVGLLGLGLAAAPAARAGWTDPRPLPGDGFSPVAATIDQNGNGAVLGATDPSPALGDDVVLGGRLLRGTAITNRRSDLAGVSVADLDVDARGSSVVAGSQYVPGPPASYQGPQVFLRGSGAAFAPALALPLTPLQATPRVARDARGDAAVAFTTADGTAMLTFRAAGGAAAAPVAISPPGATSLTVAIGDDGTVAAGWLRAGAAEVRVREPDGSMPSGTTLGAPATELAVAVGAKGRVLAAAAVGAEGQPRQLVAVDRPGPGAFAAPRALDAAAVISSPSVSVSGRERLVAWRRGTGATLSYARAAGRRGSKPLRAVRVPRVINAKGVAGDRTIDANVRAAVAGDGGAVVAFSYHGAIHTAVRRPGRRSFAAPRAVSGLGGGSLTGTAEGFGLSSRPLAVARHGRAILAFARPSDGRPQVAVLRRGGRDRSIRGGARPPVLRWGRPTFDLTTTPAHIRIPVDCSRACRATFSVQIRNQNRTQRQTVRVVVPRKGTRRLDVALDRRVDELVRRPARQGVRLRIRADATTRYGGRTNDVRTYLRFPITP